jgi:hypothetical protein
METVAKKKRSSLLGKMTEKRFYKKSTLVNGMKTFFVGNIRAK